MTSDYNLTHTREEWLEAKKKAKADEEAAEPVAVRNLRVKFNQNIKDYANTDPHRWLAVYETKLRHNELDGMAPEAWISVAKVFDKEKAKMCFREQLYWMDSDKPLSKWSINRQREVLKMISDIYLGWKIQGPSETLKVIEEYLKYLSENEKRE